jgi:hypothetical protein
MSNDVDMVMIFNDRMLSMISQLDGYSICIEDENGLVDRETESNK